VALERPFAEGRAPAVDTCAKPAFALSVGVARLAERTERTLAFELAGGEGAGVVGPDFQEWVHAAGICVAAVAQAVGGAGALPKASEQRDAVGVAVTAGTFVGAAVCDAIETRPFEPREVAAIADGGLAAGRGGAAARRRGASPGIGGRVSAAGAAAGGVTACVAAPGGPGPRFALDLLVIVEPDQIGTAAGCRRQYEAERGCGKQQPGS
jgi:hypothetical protein